MERSRVSYEGDDLNLKATELRLGLPGSEEPEKVVQVASTTTITAAVRSNKRASPEASLDSRTSNAKSSFLGSSNCDRDDDAPPTKTQVVGWPPIRSYRKNNTQVKKNEGESGGVLYVKVSVDGAPYLRKIDLKVYKSYPEILKALENMFKLTIGSYCEREGYNGSDYAPTYEDKDGDWMLVGDVPWEMFVCSCKRMRIMRGSEARGLSSL